MPIETPRSMNVRKYFRWQNYVYFMQWRLKVLMVRLYAAKSTKELRRQEKRGLFVDCGSNLGQGFDFFSRYYTAKFFDYALFEPNPHCFELLLEKIDKLEGYKIQLFQKAISTSEGKLNFYGLEENEGGKYSVGGSVLKQHNSKSYEVSDERSILVDTISFSDFIREQSQKYSKIIVKMDIEGGEYPVIEDLLSAGLFDSIDTFYIEFHSQYMSAELKSDYVAAEKQFWRRVKKTTCSALLWI